MSLKLLHEPETEDPILSVVNLIDIFLVIIAALALFLSYTGKWQGIGSFTVKNWIFLILSGLAGIEGSCS